MRREEEEEAEEMIVVEKGEKLDSVIDVFILVNI